MGTGVPRLRSNWDAVTRISPHDDCTGAIVDTMFRRAGNAGMSGMVATVYFMTLFMF